jgi:hypothetical protein
MAVSDVKRVTFRELANTRVFGTEAYVLASDYDALASSYAELKAKCAHCPSPAVVDITLGDPINYSLCERCSEIEDKVVYVAEARITALESERDLYRNALYKAFNQFENITVADTLEIAKDRAHRFIGWYYNNIETPNGSPASGGADGSAALAGSQDGEARIAALESERAEFAAEHMRRGLALESERGRLREALIEATDFVDRHSEPWYRSGQALLTKCRAALAGSQDEGGAERG